MSHARLIVDTSTLMLEQINVCIHNDLRPIIHKIIGQKIVVPNRIIEKELGVIAQKNIPEKLEQAERARQGLRIIEQNSDLFEFFGEDSDANYVDHLIGSVFLRYCVQVNLILLTQDRSLAHDILLLNSLQSFKFNFFHVLSIDTDGKLISLSLDGETICYERDVFSFKCSNCSSQNHINKSFASYLSRIRIRDLCVHCDKQK